MLGLDVIAFTRRVFHPFSACQLYLAAGITDQAKFLKMGGRDRDRFAADAEDLGYLLMRQQEKARRLVIVDVEQKAAELLVDRVDAVADGGLRYLHRATVCWRTYILPCAA